MPYIGICTQCNATINSETKNEFGNALIEHHQENRYKSSSFLNRCSVFQCIEMDELGNIVDAVFGLEASMEIVCRAWSGTIWYEKDRGS